MEPNINYEIIYSNNFVKHVKRHQLSGQKSILEKIDCLLDELRKHPYIGTGRPESLSYDKKGKWSRRITQKHRLIYQVNDTTITVSVLSAFGHYNDK
ncbi:hypothetical protein FACS1894145_4030 [Bacteroidia bacterium]|nr:hypothetical protein FACS189446_0860 [Bacteroidia bacterium]GHU79579.1 hypothetical protein FACS1894145_4030 [Bacteroidia bacterium]